MKGRHFLHDRRRARRVDVLSTPNTSTSNSDAASATFGCSRNSGVAASEIPRRTTRVTLSSDPKCSLAIASAFNAARRVARRPSSTLNSAPICPKNLGAPSSTATCRSRTAVPSARNAAPSGRLRYAAIVKLVKPTKSGIYDLFDFSKSRMRRLMLDRTACAAPRRTEIGASP